jgi:hypothetical protein
MLFEQFDQVNPLILADFIENLASLSEIPAGLNNNLPLWPTFLPITSMR